MPKFVLKEMDLLYLDELRSTINQLMANLESLPVSKGPTESKYGLQKLKKYNHRWVLTKIFNLCVFCTRKNTARHLFRIVRVCLASCFSFFQTFFVHFIVRQPLSRCFVWLPNVGLLKTKMKRLAMNLLRVQLKADLNDRSMAFVVFFSFFPLFILCLSLISRWSTCSVLLTCRAVFSFRLVWLFTRSAWFFCFWFWNRIKTSNFINAWLTSFCMYTYTSLNACLSLNRSSLETIWITIG